jgi:hypothetical protein
MHIETPKNRFISLFTTKVVHEPYIHTYIHTCIHILSHHYLLQKRSVGPTYIHAHLPLYLTIICRRSGPYALYTYMHAYIHILSYHYLPQERSVGPACINTNLYISFYVYVWLWMDHAHMHAVYTSLCIYVTGNERIRVWAMHTCMQVYAPKIFVWVCMHAWMHKRTCVHNVQAAVTLCIHECRHIAALYTYIFEDRHIEELYTYILTYSLMCIDIYTHLTCKII